MARSSRAQKPESPDGMEPVTQNGGTAPVPRPPDSGVDAIGELLGTAPDPSSRQRIGGLRRHTRWMLGAGVAVALIIPLFLWLQYRTQHVTSKNAAVRGHVAEIGTRITGRVAAVPVDDGDRVDSGQVLVQLEEQHLQADVQEARAELAALQRTIDVERATIDMGRGRLEQQGPESAARIAAAQARTEAARVAAEDAQRTHELQEILNGRDGMVSKEALRGAESQRRAAAARLDEAQANAVVTTRTVALESRVARDDIAIRERRMAVLEADLLAAQARLTRAEADLESAAIRAPERGAIVRRIVQPGAAIEAGQPVISMWLGDELWVEAWIDEDQLRFVRSGNKAIVTFHWLPGEEYAGRVDRIGLSTDLEIPDSEVPQPRFTRMDGAPVVGVRIQLDRPPPDLVPGFSAVVAIEKSR